MIKIRKISSVKPIYYRVKESKSKKEARKMKLYDTANKKK